jgi:hypothetical protein
MKFNKDANTRSTVLVVLVSGDNETTLVVNNFAHQFQKGLDDSVSDDPPDIHCLYRSEREEAFQYKLTQNGNPLPDTTAIPHVGSLKEQLESFFKSLEVRKGLETKGQVYLIVCAHGTSTTAGLGIAILGKIMKELLLALTPSKPKRSTRLARARDLWHRAMQPNLPGGMAIPSGDGTQKGITITELNQALMQLQRVPDTMLLHSCNLSSVESLFEMRHVGHQIACETSLKSYMCISECFSALENGLPPQEFTNALFDRLRCQNKPSGRAEGIFSSNKSSEVISLVDLLNRLGRELDTKLSEGNRVTVEKLKSARTQSTVDSLDLVDLRKFSVFCANDLGSPFIQLSSDINQAIGAIQYGLKISPTYGHMSDCGGISVFFPAREAAIDVKDLPSNFSSVAGDWIKFLENWLI